MSSTEAIEMVNRLIAGQANLSTMDDVDAYVAKFQEQIATIRWEPTIQERREWDEHIARLRSARQAQADRKQARVNARVVAAVRSAACPRCFSTHAGEC